MGLAEDLAGYGMLGSPTTTAYGNTQGMPRYAVPPITPLGIENTDMAAPALDLSSLNSLVAGGPQLGNLGGTGGGFFGNMSTVGKVGAGLQLAQGLMGLWAGMKQMKLAKRAFKDQRNMANINLNNSIKSYNTALSDRARARGVAEGQSQAQVDSYVSRNSMTRDISRNNVGG